MDFAPEGQERPVRAEGAFGERRQRGSLEHEARTETRHHVPIHRVPARIGGGDGTLAQHPRRHRVDHEVGVERERLGDDDGAVDGGETEETELDDGEGVGGGAAGGERTLELGGEPATAACHHVAHYRRVSDQHHGARRRSHLVLGQGEDDGQILAHRHVVQDVVGEVVGGHHDVGHVEP